MEVVITPFWLPKAGNTQEEYEDAFYPKHGGKKKGEILRFAVADGASEGMLSGEWAAILVKSFCRPEAPRTGTIDFLERAYRGWDSWKRSYLRKRKKRNRPIQWYEEPGLQAGAFSAFVGLTFVDPDKKWCGDWKAIAFGDSCLFLVQGQFLATRFPIGNSSDFSSRPLLISSNSAHNQNVLGAAKIDGGKWRIGDQFYLMTDALASWFLREHEAGRIPWRILSSLEIDDQRQLFKEWVDGLRASYQMRNDDVTMIHISVV